jgi:integrase/recombinase XerD
MTASVFDAAGRRRSPTTMPGYHAGLPTRNKGMRYPADPPTLDEIVAVMRHAANRRHGWRLCAAVRSELRRLAARAGIRRCFAPHQLRHALELAREGVPLNIIQRQLGHANLGTTSIYLQGIDPEEIITAVRTRRAPVMSATAGLPL